MKSISPTPLSGDFSDALFQFLRTDGIEGFNGFVYSDSKDIPTIGVDYALAVRGSDNKWIAKPNYAAALKNAGIDLTAAQLATLTTDVNGAIDALNHKAHSVNFL